MSGAPVIEFADDARTLVDELLESQRTLTAVERFSLLHEGHALPDKKARYRSLLPANAPKPGQQYGFEVDLDKCSGCKGCVTACHSLNGLEDGESWRKVGLLVAPTAAPLADGLPARKDAATSLHQHVTTACHHCVDPGCLNGCPVLAYDKDPVSGIVRHLDDQCIGCQYCVMKCPYEVPRYSSRLGIVRKCDMCANRLTAGEAPACVQSCPNEAIKITLVASDALLAEYRSSKVGLDPASASNFQPSIFPGLLPDAPDSSITVPTTRFLSNRVRSDAVAADVNAVVPAHPHVPLAFLLVLTQLAAGASLAAAFTGDARPAWLAAVAVTLGLGLGALHLGQPFRAWRVFLGWRRSWFSREAIVFGAYAPAALAVVAARMLPALEPMHLAVAITGGLLGLGGVFCSSMLYIDTRRELWGAVPVAVKFFGTTLVLGLGAAALATPAGAAQVVLLLAVASAVAIKLGFERRALEGSDGDRAATPASKAAALLNGVLAPLWRARLSLGIIGGILFPLLVLATGSAALIAWGLAVLVAGELIERHLFFVAGVTRVMPGGIAA